MVQEGILKFSANGKQKLVIRDSVTAKIHADLARKYSKPAREEDLSQLPTPEYKKQSHKFQSDGLNQKFHEVLQVSRSELKVRTNNPESSLTRRKEDFRFQQDMTELDPKRLQRDFDSQASQKEERCGASNQQATLQQDSSAFQQVRDKSGESSFEPFVVATVESMKKSFQKAGQKQIRGDSYELSCSQNALLDDNSVSLPVQPMFQSKKIRLQTSQ
jgi:hypothetical protein